MRRYLILFIVLLIPTTTFASSVTGDYNDFSVTGLTSGDYWESWVFDDTETSLADATCGQYGSSGALSNFTIEEVGFGGTELEPGDYTLLIGAGGACGGGWEHNGECGVGKTITECEVAYGSFPLTGTYGVTYTFTVEGAQQGSSTPSSTNATTTMTEFEMELSYYMLLILLFIVAGAVYALVRPR